MQNKIYNYKNVWPDRPSIVRFIEPFKFLVAFSIFYTNGVTQIKMPFKKESSNVGRLIHGLKNIYDQKDLSQYIRASQ